MIPCILAFLVYYAHGCKSHILSGAKRRIFSDAKWPTCARAAPQELSDFQHVAYAHIAHRKPCALLLSRACTDFDQFLDEERFLRRKATLAAMEHAWGNYAKRALGEDEINPVTGTSTNSWGGFGMTLVDALDTLLIMNMDNQYAVAVEWIKQHLNFDKDINLNVFETTIRLLGGLLGAYALRPHDTVLLEKAKELGNRLYPAFASGRARLPYSDVNLLTGTVKDIAGFSSPAEAYVPLEWKYLAEATGNCTFSRGVDSTLRLLARQTDMFKTGVLPIMLGSSGSPHEHQRNAFNKFSLGARGDSFYEYLLKAWLWSNQKDDLARLAYRSFLKAFPEFVIDMEDDSLGIIEKKNQKSTAKMDHLACFLPGVFALDRLFGRSSESYDLAHGLIKTCYRMSARTASFLAPEISILSKTTLLNDEGSMHNLLRPETLESLFVLSVSANQDIQQATLNDASYVRQIQYENWGWDIFQGFQRSARTRYGYSSVKNVQKSEVEFSNDTPSYFFAETLKYAYLLFEPKRDAKALLDRFLLTTEAHFIPRRNGVCPGADKSAAFQEFLDKFA